MVPMSSRDKRLLSVLMLSRQNWPVACCLFLKYYTNKLGWKSSLVFLYSLLVKVGNQSQSHHSETNQKKGKGADTWQKRHQKSGRRHKKNCQRVNR